MITTYHNGDYTVFGHPYVILTEYENHTKFCVQAFIFFESNRPVIYKEMNWEIDKAHSSFGINSDYLKQQLFEGIRNDIFHVIILWNGETPSTTATWSKIAFTEDNHIMLGLLRDRFPAELAKVEANAKDGELRELIKGYNSIVITKL